MKFISSKQAAQAWGISPRRVALLASQGRISGAILTGNTWLIPDNAEKPADSRRKEFALQSKEPEAELYPYIVCFVRSEDQVNRFSPEEKQLYRACTLYEAGDFDAAAQLVEPLLTCTQLNIRLGAQYLLSFICMYLADYASADKYAVLFQAEYHGICTPSPTLRLLFYAFEAEMGRTSRFVESIGKLDFNAFSPELLPFVAGQKMYAELIKCNMGGKLPDITPYEVICLSCDAEGYAYAAMYLHILLTIFYATQGETEKEHSHLKRAIELCITHQLYFTLACLLSIMPETMEAMLISFPPEAKIRIQKIIEACVNARIEYAAYKRKRTVISLLKENDYRLISCCLRNCSINQMAEQFGLSRSGINKRLSILYDKLGVGSHKELRSLFLNSVLEWGEPKKQ